MIHQLIKVSSCLYDNLLICESQYSGLALDQISPKELIIFLAVVALWLWACSLFYLRF